MKSPLAHIAATGVCNLASLKAALSRIGVESVVCADAQTALDCERLILPGVGAFAAAMNRLAMGGLSDAIRDRVTKDRRTLAICLGLQLLCEGSEESPGIAGLGLLDGMVSRFSSGVRVPQLGWNRVEVDADCRVLEPGWAYFANSYRLIGRPSGWRIARSEHGGDFVAGIERGAVVACQFHPELSGTWGLNLLKRWVLCEGMPAC